MIQRVPREYAELRIDLSRDALAELSDILGNAQCSTKVVEELQNLRNQVRNMVDRFDYALTE